MQNRLQDMHGAEAKTQQRSEPPPRRRIRPWRNRRQSLGGLFNLPQTPKGRGTTNDWGERRDIDAAAFAAQLQDRREHAARERSQTAPVDTVGGEEVQVGLSAQSDDEADEDDIVAASDTDSAPTPARHSHKRDSAVVGGRAGVRPPTRLPTDGTNERKTDEEDYLYPGERYMDPRANRRRAPTTIVYAATDSNSLVEPELLLADPDSLDAFRLAYLKYVRDHGIKQRRRPRNQRTPPLSVMECIEPDCLQHICMWMLPQGQRNMDPTQVRAVDIHQFVMGNGITRKGRASAASKALRALRCTINATQGLANVQKLFMAAHKITVQQRVKVAPKTMVKHLLKALKPKSVQYAISDAMHYGTATERSARTDVTAFYDLVQRTATTFRDAAKLGLVLGNSERETYKNEDDKDKKRKTKTKTMKKHERKEDEERSLPDYS